MTKALRSIKDTAEREIVISRRLHGKERGLGWLSACDARHIDPTRIK
jgi:hypothetical protein